MQPLGTKKITQPGQKKSSNLLGQKKSHTTSQDKINHATSRDKKSHNLLGQKKHATSWVKQKSCILLGQNEIMQPLKTTKKSRSQ